MSLKEPEGQDGKQEGFRDAIRAFAILSGVGIYLCAFIGVFLFVGKCIDDFLGTGNGAKVICLVLSFPAAFYSLYRQLKTYHMV